MKRQRFYCFISFAQNSDIHMSGKRRNSTIGPKWEDKYLHSGQLRTSRCIKTVIIFQHNLSSTSRSTEQSNYSRKLGTLSDPATTRSDKHACVKPMLIDHEQTRWTRKIQRKAFLIGYSPSQLISRTWRRMCSHIPLQGRTQIRKAMLQKSRHKNGSTIFMLASAKTKRDLFCEQKIGDLMW